MKLKEGTQLDWQEKEANIFACELLMPREWIEKDAKKMTIKELSKRYGVDREIVVAWLMHLKIKFMY